MHIRCDGANTATDQCVISQKPYSFFVHGYKKDSATIASSSSEELAICISCSKQNSCVILNLVTAMRNDKASALQLRRNNKSYNEISRELNIPKSTLSGWFANDGDSRKVKRRLSDKRSANVAARIKKFVEGNKKRWSAWRENARNEAKRTFPKICSDPLFIAGLMLYWAEGDNQKKTPFRFTNTNPKMIALYAKFLKKILKIPSQRIRPTAILYPDLNEKECVDFWSKVVGVPPTQFYKTQFIKGRHPKKRLSHGICTIMCGNGQTKEMVRVWIDLLSKTL